MKYVIVALSGAADQHTEEPDVKTPFEMAKIPNLNALTKAGKIGEVKLYPERLEPYPDVTFLNLLGYEADKDYTGRGPIEAANLELSLEENEIPFRLNFVTEYDGNLADPQATGLTTKESKALISFLNKKLASDFVRFFPGVGYRHVVVLKDAQGFDAVSAKTYCPHDIIGRPVNDYLPKGPGGELLKKLMYDAKLLLQDHEINQVRVDLQENPANMIWVWGQGRPPHYEKFSDRFGYHGSLVSDAEYAKGIARLTGLTTVDTRSSHKDLSDNYKEKAQALMEELEQKDLVCVHLRECDEAARAGNLKEKVAALEAADYFIVSKVKKYLETHPDTRVLVTPCHALPWQKKKRTKTWSPFVVVGSSVQADESDRFTELAAKASEFKIDKNTDLMPFFLGK